MKFRKYFNILKDSNFNVNKERVGRENKTGVELILLFYSLILLLNVIGEISQGNNIFANIPLSMQIGLILAALAVYFLYLKRHIKNYTLWLYVLETALLVTTMIGGLVNRPHEMTFTFLFYLLLFPLLILDKPWHIFLFIVIIGESYAFLAHAFKDPAVFSRDAVHLVNTMLMGMSASLYFLVVRMRNIDYAEHQSELAEEDPLTKLYNRYGARKHIQFDKPGIFIYIDLDCFKRINDLFGHGEGDTVIVETADVLRNSFRKEDIVVRLGGDEFAVFAKGTWNKEQIDKKLNELLQAVHSIHKEVDGTDYSMSASIGCAHSSNGCESLEQLVRTADQAMYEAKKAGKNGYHIVEVS